MYLSSLIIYYCIISNIWSMLSCKCIISSVHTYLLQRRNTLKVLDGMWYCNYNSKSLLQRWHWEYLISKFMERTKFWGRLKWVHFTDSIIKAKFFIGAVCTEKQKKMQYFLKFLGMLKKIGHDKNRWWILNMCFFINANFLQTVSAFKQRVVQ